MSNLTDPEQLAKHGYRNADRLAARIRLHANYSVGKEGLFAWIFNRMLTLAGPRCTLLELGCGRGDLWQENARRIPPDWQITLTDLSPGMLADCKKYVGNETRFRFGNLNAERLPFPSRHFDMVLANMMLYHVADRASAIREIRRVLKPKGVLIAMTNGDNHMRELFTVIQKLENNAGIFTREISTVFHATFSLQNGGEQLRAQFADVRTEHYENDLFVTALPPIVDYIASTLDEPDAVLLLPQNQAIIDDLKRRIETEGGIRIPKEVGMFIARGVAG